MAPSPSLKAALGVALLALTVAAAAGLLALTAAVEDPPRGAGEVRVSIQDASGTFLFNATVAVDNASALGALDAASRAGGFAYQVDAYGGLGDYVVTIAGHEARGADGWQYWVLRDGAWVQGDRSASRFAVAPGEWVQWRWSSVGDTAPFAG